MVLRGGTGAWIKAIIGIAFIAVGHHAHTVLYQFEQQVRRADEINDILMASYEAIGREATVYGAVVIGLVFLFLGVLGMLAPKKR